MRPRVFFAFPAVLCTPDHGLNMVVASVASQGNLQLSAFPPHTHHTPPYTHQKRTALLHVNSRVRFFHSSKPSPRCGLGLLSSAAVCSIPLPPCGRSLTPDSYPSIPIVKFIPSNQRMPSPLTAYDGCSDSLFPLGTWPSRSASATSRFSRLSLSASPMWALSSHPMMLGYKMGGR